MIGPEEFLEGLGIGLRSFVGGTVGMYAYLKKVLMIDNLSFNQNILCTSVLISGKEMLHKDCTLDQRLCFWLQVD